MQRGEPNQMLKSDQKNGSNWSNDGKKSNLWKDLQTKRIFCIWAGML